MPAPEKLGRYEILETLGSGGMGLVLKARDPGISGRVVAIKLLKQDADNDEIHLRFIQEAHAAGVLDHENIVRILDVGEHGRTPFIVMEFVDGVTLSEWIRRRTPAPLARRLQLMEQLCAGLGYAHSLGIVHRDIKPANLMVDRRRGQLKILDFGIAKLADSANTNPGVLLGSFNYMSPEQVRGLPIDHRSDVFAVGAVLFELLTYRQAFPGGLGDGVLYRIAEQPAPRLSTALPDAPDELDRIVAKALSGSPDERYQDLADLERDVARLRGRLEAEGSEDASSLGAGEAQPDASQLDPVPDNTNAVVRVATSPAAPVARPEPPAERKPTVVSRLEDLAISQALPPGPSPDASVVLRSPLFRVPHAPPPPVKLIVTASADPDLLHRTVPITANRFTLGRSADLSVADPHVSRLHAIIEYVSDDFMIRDAGSANGTFVNGRRVRSDAPEPLPFGTVIRIGGTALTFAYARDTALPDLAGALVAGRYTLERRIRQSAKSAVYAARDRNTQAGVAIKLLAPELVRHPAYRRQFESEVHVVSRLDHPHICRIVDSYSECEVRAERRSPLRVPALCYTLCEGGSLQRLLDENESLPTEQLANWMLAIAGALQHAHDREIVHADLKPSAIVLDRTRTHPYLTDFAIAQRLAGDDGRPIAGAPAFMAPEQWDAGPVLPAVDQFSLAVITYYLVTGLRPFEGQENPVVRERNFRQPPAPAHEEAKRNNRPELAPAVSQVLNRALATDPGQRFESVAVYARALVDAFQDQSRGFQPRAFLSYQRELSAGWVWTFARELRERHGIAVYFDVARIDRAVRFPAKLEDEIRACDVFVCFLSKTTLDSDWVRREIQLARQYQRPMIPVVDDGFTRPAGPIDPAVGDLLEFDFVRLHHDYVEAAIERLASIVKNTHALAAGRRVHGHGAAP